MSVREVKAALSSMVTVTINALLIYLQYVTYNHDSIAHEHRV